MTTFKMKINDFGGPNLPKVNPNQVKNHQKYNKIAVKRSTTNKDHQKYAPRPSRRGIWSPERLMAGIELRARGLIFGPVGPPKVL